MDAKKRKMESGSRLRERDGNGGLLELQLANLPRSLLMEIFSRLPLMSLGKCRCVCKAWFRIISNPEFAKLHLSVSPTCILIKSKPPNREPKMKRLLLSQVFEDSITNRFRFDRMDFTSRFDLPDIGYFSLVNSCNGLVCLSGGEDEEEEEEESIYVCNPVLGEYITIQLPEESCDGSFGLGFSSRSNEFKVLRTFRDENFGLLRKRTGTVKAEIYTLGTGLWRSIENVPDDIDISSLGFNSFLHGTLHWATVNGYPNFSCKITCFNFEEELFGEIPLPPQFKPDLDHHQLRLGVYDGCLSASCFRVDVPWEFDIWVMKEYGVKESWVTQFRIDAYESYCETDFYIEEDDITGCYPLMFLKNGEIMISFNYQFVVSYNLERGTLRDTGLFHTTGEFDAVGYTPCFVSLEDVAKGGEQITRKRCSSKHANFLVEG